MTNQHGIEQFPALEGGAAVILPAWASQEGFVRRGPVLDDENVPCLDGVGDPCPGTR